MVSAVACKYCKNIKFNPVSFEFFSSIKNLIKCVFTICINTEFIMVKITVKAESYKKVVFMEEFAPLICDKCAICLCAEKNLTVKLV